MLISSLILVFLIGRACREGGVIKSLVLLTGDGGGDYKALYFYFGVGD